MLRLPAVGRLQGAKEQFLSVRRRSPGRTQLVHRFIHFMIPVRVFRKDFLGNAIELRNQGDPREPENRRHHSAVRLA
jgi:hypothetical protein